MFKMLLEQHLDTMLYAIDRIPSYHILVIDSLLITYININKNIKTAISIKYLIIHVIKHL